MFHAFQVWILNFYILFCFFLDFSFTKQNYFLNSFFERTKKKHAGSKSSRISIQRTGEFISNVINEAALANPPSHNFDAFRISYQGEVRNLDESSIENVLNWDKVGVHPDV